MKTIIEFDNDTESEQLDRALKADEFVFALEEISNEVFRPARKHGYQDEEIRGLMDAIGPEANELVSLLEKKFYDILESRDLNKFLG